MPTDPDVPPVGLVVIAHAPFAHSLFDCAQHVYACDPERCAVLDILPDADVAAEVERGRQAIAEVDRGSGVLVMTDLFGATPGNIASQLAEPGRVEVVAGVNLPMLLRVLCYRQGTPLADMPEKAVAGGVSGIIKIASSRAQTEQNQRLFPHDPNDGPARLQDQ
jgi:PTS system mannose-specific IIA component